MFRTIRSIRRKLHEIRYHSALPAQTGWTAAADAALLAAILLAIPVTWLCDRLVVRPEVAIMLDGQIALHGEEGTIDGRVHRDGLPAFDWQVYANLGRFTVTIDDDLHGWPFTTSIARQRAVIDLDLFSDPKPRFDVELAEGDPVRAAIESALARVDDPEVVTIFREGPPPASTHWLRWLAVAGVWWITLSVGLTGGVRLVQFGALRAAVRRARRRAARLATGRCADCGYDLRGLEFNERCPECGALVE
ncbi:MAG: hypothetical protein ACYTGG_05500 [Planctomycetota bacterium]|jgi:hypothetical protein